MNLSVLAKNGGFVAQSLRELRGNRPGVVAALFTMLLFLVGCGGSSKTATPTPTFTPAGGSYSATQNVTVSDTNQNAALYCTNDGSAPTTSSTQCANPITVSQSQTIKAIAIASGMDTSAVATAQYTISATAAAPTVTAIGPANGSSSGGTSVTIVGTNFNGVTAVNFGTNQAAKFTVNSSTSITTVSPAGAGSVHITVIAAGGTSATTTADVFSYGAAPSITGLSPASATVGSAGITLTVSGGNFTSDAVVKWNGASLTTTYVGSTQLTATVPASLLTAAGTATVTVTESGGASTGVAFAINAAAPSIAGISPAQGPSAGGTAVNITGSNFTGVSAVKFGAAAATSFTVISANSITAYSPLGSAGTVDIQVVTPSGSSATGVNDQFTYSAAPTVTAISPSTGKLAGGTTVAISGFNLAQATSVSFGSNADAGFTVNSSTSITAVSPPGSAGTVDIRVVTPGGESAISGADQFTFTSAPSVTGVAPSAGSLAGGTAVTITGENFINGATTVYFNGNLATNVSVSADGSTISATSPGGSVGTVEITVATSGGTSLTSSADHFTYTPAPTVNSVSPATGSSDGGTAVTITGTNFSGTGYTVTAVNFGGVPATFSVSADGTSISATSPAGSAGPVDVTVVTPGGSVSSATQFTYAPPPVVSAINPSSGQVTGGTSVTITGSGFTGATAVNFGLTPGTGLTVNSATSISVVSPAGTGTVDVTVVTPIRTSATGTADQFTYTLAISGKVLSGPASSGTPISASVQLYAAGTTGYGAGSQPIGSAVQTNSTTGAFPAIVYDCSTLTAPGDQLYLVATGTSNTDAVLMTALGSCANIATSFPSGVTINEATTVASAFALSAFANADTTNGHGIDIGAPTGGGSCNDTDGWKSTGPSTCNYIGLQHAFATVQNLVDIPSGKALAVTPAYCKSTPCVTYSSSTTTPYYNTSIVPQGRINAMANALAACVSGTAANCTSLINATTITTATPVASLASGTTIDPTDTLQAALSIAYCPGDKTGTTCGVNVKGASGIYSLVTSSSPYQPTLLSSTSGNTTTDLSLAIIYQGGGLGGPTGASAYTYDWPEATVLAIDGSGNIWAPTMTPSGGSLAVFNNQGAPITTSGASSTAFGGYTTGIYNPLSIAIDQNGNAWIGNSPSDGNHGVSDSGSLSAIQLNGTALSILTVNGTAMQGLTDSALMTPVPYGLAIDASGNVWLSSNPGGTGNEYCGGGTYGGSILEFDPGTGSVENTGSPDGYLSYSDNSSCPMAIAFDQSGYLWTYDNGPGGQDLNYGLLQLNVSSSTGTPGTVAAGQYYETLNYLTNNACGIEGASPMPFWNLVIDGSGNSWFADPFCMAMIPNMTQTGASAAINLGNWGAALQPDNDQHTYVWPMSATVIDGEGNAWAAQGGTLFAYNSTNATMDYTSSNADTAMLSPWSNSTHVSGYDATDPSANASGRADGSGTFAMSGGYPMDGSGLLGTGWTSKTFFSLALDSSGNLWVSGVAQASTSSRTLQGSQLTEYIGIAAPVQTPLASALAAQNLGARP
jgi:hypothetical protein